MSGLLTLSNFLSSDMWRHHASQHRARARVHTVPARRRRDHGQLHPVEDFLFQYYPYPFSLLDHWHPGVGVALEWQDGNPTEEGFSEKFYSLVDGRLSADPQRMGEKARIRMSWTYDLLVATRDRLPNFGCYGLHEWAMVYRGEHVRHAKIAPLRLAQAKIDAFVESRALCCSHHDAFRFFAAAARPLNRLQPSLEARAMMEQPGCVHANMDLYKWAAKSMPWVGSELLLDCFELALSLRDLDMRASPYDLSAWACEPIRIETVEGRQIYEAEQRRLAQAAQPLRERVIECLRRTLAR